MSFVPRLLAILLVTLAPESRERSEPTVFGSTASACAVPRPSLEVCPPAFRPAHLPSPIESFFERLDETALDEEDSSRVEDHGLVSLTFLDFGASLASGLSSSLSPASPHTLMVFIAPILRC
jgi:hypothetical protein